MRTVSSNVVGLVAALTIATYACRATDLGSGIGEPQAGQPIVPVLLITPTAVHGHIGEMLRFAWTVHDDSAKGPDITDKYDGLWRFDSDDETVVVTNEPDRNPTGVAFCVSAGSTKVTASVLALLGQKAAIATVTCDTVHMKAGQAPAGAAATQLTVGDASTGATISNPTFSWRSNNPAIASVTSDGLATPLSPGLAVMSVTQTVKGVAKPVATGEFYVTGPGSCSLNPTGDHFKSMKVAVQSDPGSHAAAIAMPATIPVLDLAFSGTLNTNFHAQVVASGSAPFVSANGGWLGADCAFVANGQGDVAGQKNVGVRLTGTWTNGTLVFTYTVGTNGELSGGPVVYTLSS